MEQKKELLEGLAHALAEPDKAVLLFEDEASFYRQPTAASLYYPSGSVQPTMPLSQRSNTRTAALGALDAASGQLHFELSSQARVPTLLRFFQKLLSAYPDKERIYLVMDNWPVHKHERLEALYQREPRLKVLFLPTYAPWLNPIEKVWRRLKQNFTHAHHMAHEPDKLKASIIDGLNAFNQEPDKTLRYVGLKTEP